MHDLYVAGEEDAEYSTLLVEETSITCRPVGNLRDRKGFRPIVLETTGGLIHFEDDKIYGVARNLLETYLTAGQPVWLHPWGYHDEEVDHTDVYIGTKLITEPLRAFVSHIAVPDHTNPFFRFLLADYPTDKVNLDEGAYESTSTIDTPDWIRKEELEIDEDR